MFKRLLKPSIARSFFLFGPRATGKSTLLHQLLPETDALWVDLLDPDTESSLSRRPSQLTAILRRELESKRPRKWVVIDEVQKIPELLSIAQQFIQRKEFLFALTGSSARKLKRGGANLLGGRASWFELSSLAHIELGKRFELDEVLHWGSLPEVFELEPTEKVRMLRAYGSLYLKEEVVAEQLIRKIQPFRSFLELAALQNSQIVNYAKFARDCNVDITTIQGYFEILADTLIGFELPPFDLSIRKRQRRNPKFFLFDTGVARSLAGILEQPLDPRTQAYGKVFEQFVITEFRRLILSLEKDWRMSYLTTRDGAEIDLIIEAGTDLWAIEIKSSEEIDLVEVRKFESLAGDLPNARLLFISRCPRAQKHGRVECLPWDSAFQEVFQLEPATNTQKPEF